jgi:hypothetical protein
MYVLTYEHRQAKMEMETEDDVALEGSVDPPSSAIPLIMTQECQPERDDKALDRNEELVALS